jgi:hypothetical protein
MPSILLGQEHDISVHLTSNFPLFSMKAEEVVQTMLEAGVPPGQRVYSLLAYAWSKSWRWESSSGPVILTRGSSGPGSVTDGKSTTKYLSNIVDQDLDDRTTELMSILGDGVLSGGENLVQSELLSPSASVSAATASRSTSSSSEGQQQEQRTVHRKKGDFVIRTEDVLYRCLAAGLTPDVSLRRSLLSVWCRDRQASINRNSYFDSSDSTSPGPGESPAEVGVPQSGEPLLSIQKAEDLLARISVLSCVKALKELDPETQLHSTGADSDSLASKMISFDTEEGVDTLLPHPSVYMQVAAAWNDDRQSFSPGSSITVKKAQSFLARVNRDIDALMVFSVQSPLGAGYEESKVQGPVISDANGHTTDHQSLTPSEGENGPERMVPVPAAVRSRGLYIAYNLLLAAHALASTGTMHCHEAEVR